MNRRVLDIENQEPTDEDIDEIPFSLFIDRHNFKQDCWEWLLEEIKTCPKVMCLDIDVGFYWGVYAITAFGYFKMGHWDEATDTASVVATFNYFWRTGDIVFASGRFPEIVRIQTSFASEDDVLTYLLCYLPQFYPRKARDCGLHTLITVNEDDDMYQFFDRFQARIFQAFRLAGEVRSKYGVQVDAQGLMDSLYEQDQYDATARSVNTWAELPGVRTGYIDNIGIFLPTQWELDDIRTQELVIEYGERARRYCVLRLLEPTYARLWSEGIGQVPIIGRIGGWVRNMNKAAEYLFPRVRAFGRQTTPIPTIDEFVQDAQIMNFTKFESFVIQGQFSMPAGIVPHITFPLDQLREFYQKLQSANVADPALWGGGVGDNSIGGRFQR